MRSHDQARLDALRFFKNAVLAVEKEQKKELDDAGVIEVATKQASDRRDSIKAFEEGGREAAAAKEAAELVVLEEFLPPQMSAEELIGLIKATVSEVGAASIQDKGKLMGKHPCKFILFEDALKSCGDSDSSMIRVSSCCKGIGCVFVDDVHFWHGQISIVRKPRNNVVQARTRLGFLSAILFEHHFIAEPISIEIHRRGE